MRLIEYLITPFLVLPQSSTQKRGCIVLALEAQEPNSRGKKISILLNNCKNWTVEVFLHFKSVQAYKTLSKVHGT